MKIFLPILLTFSLQAAAQTQTPAPQPQPPATPTPSQPAERKADGDRPLNLNLKLDDASRYRIMSGSTEERTSGGPLPSLGGDARNLGTLRSDPYPKSSDNLP